MDARLTPGERPVNGRAGQPGREPAGRGHEIVSMKSNGTVSDGKMNAVGGALHSSHGCGGDRRRGGRGAHRRRGGGSLDDPPRGAADPGRAPDGRGGCRGAHPGVGPGARGPRPDPRDHARRGPIVRSRLADRLRQRGPQASSRRPPRDARSGLPAEHRRDHPPGGGHGRRGGHGHRDGSAHPLAPRDGHARGYRRFGPGGDRRRYRGTQAGRRTSRLRRECVT